ncbi:hypothetical protein, partial [Ruoffia tabacinasalis]|uniref:hypothetical protein n=1 Tax=Ruoffia tabacinasalis TaxID=87458 RepID=UPI001BB1A1DC
LKMRTQHKLSLHRETLKHRNKKRAKVTASPGSSVHQHQKFMNQEIDYPFWVVGFFVFSILKFIYLKIDMKGFLKD